MSVQQSYNYNSQKPINEYSICEIINRLLNTLRYYFIYLLLYSIYYKPKHLLSKQYSENKVELLRRYAEIYFIRPEYAYFKADEGRYYSEYVQFIKRPNLEIGYEDGIISALHTNNYIFDYGMEYDKGMLEETIVYKNHRRLLYGSFEEIPLRDAAISSVVAIHVLDHITNFDAAICELSRILTKNGYALLSLFSDRVLLKLTKEYLNKSRLYNFLSKKELTEIFSKYNMTILEIKEFTCYDKFIDYYFSGMATVIPHNRSRIFTYLEKSLPWVFNILRIILLDVTKHFFQREYLLEERMRENQGYNFFILAKKQ